MSIRDDIGEESYERLRLIIGKTFPDTSSIPDEMVDEMVRSIWRRYQPEHAALGVPPPGPMTFADEEPPAGPPEANFPLYIGHARHTRDLKIGSAAPLKSDFVGHLPMVRVALPDALTAGKEDIIRTQIGDVHLSGDHLVGSIALIAEKYGDDAHLGYRPERVDLITPARLGGTRFSAIALYLGYRTLRDPAPSFYLLEAGTATGEAKVLYFGKTTDTTIVQTSWYKPTPFSSPSNKYRGALVVDHSDPVRLSVEGTEPGHVNPYIHVLVEYEKVATLSPPWPGDLTLEAAQRVAAIAEAMGVPSGIPLEGVIASLGRAQRWLHKPGVVAAL